MAGEQGPGDRDGMATEAEYEARIALADNADLQRMLEAIERGDEILGWEPGKALEYVVLRQFQLEGATVTWPFQVRLGEEVVEQIDGAVYHEGLSYLVECKDSRERVNVEPLAKLRNQLLRRPPGTLAMIFARGGYTEAARVLARYMTPISVFLWQFSELEFAVAQQKLCPGLVAKYRYAIEKGLPDFEMDEGFQ